MTTDIPLTHSPQARLDEPAHALPPGITFLLACITGLGVATLYYAQPMLALMGSSLGSSPAGIGLVPMLTQLGYALGILLLAPLGDRYDRRRIILAKALVLTLALLLCALAPSLPALLLGSLLIGLTASLAQDCLSSAATLAPEARRGRIIGMVMTGLLLGILLSRVVSGVVAEHLGWRAMFGIASGSLVLVFLATWRFLSPIPTSTTLPYLRLIGSLRDLWLTHRELRRAALAQALLSIGFSAFWTTLALHLQAGFNLGSSYAGAFGLAGAAGALMASFAGKLADRRGPQLMTKVGTALCLASFALMAVAQVFSPWIHLSLMVLAVVGFDMGVQAAMISHQSIVYGLVPEARARSNAVLITVMFIGMSSGAGLGSLLYTQLGWPGVTLLGVASSAAAFLLRLRSRH